MATYTATEIKDCIALDKLMKEYLVRKSDLLKQKIVGSGDQALLNETQKLYNESEDKFSRLNCRQKIEFLRLNETANLDFETAMQAESSVLGKNKREQNIYIALGAIVLLTGFYIIIKK